MDDYLADFDRRIEEEVDFQFDDMRWTSLLDLRRTTRLQGNVAR